MPARGRGGAKMSYALAAEQAGAAVAQNGPPAKKR
jgi:hypothetical protein